MTVTESTPRESRTPTYLIVVAIVVGGAVFALAGDFVLGVGAGAAAFAVARQAVKVWGRKSDHEVDATSQRDREATHH